MADYREVRSTKGDDAPWSAWKGKDVAEEEEEAEEKETEESSGHATIGLTWRSSIPESSHKTHAWN